MDQPPPFQQGQAGQALPRLSGEEKVREEFEAGQIRHYINEWEKFTSDKNILQTVKGMKIDFEEINNYKKNVRTSRARPFHGNKEEKAAVNEEIKSLLTKGVIVESQHEDGEFISGIFARQKTDGSYRVILNLKEFNKQTEHKKFKMETLKTALSLISNGCWMASIDLVSAYYSVPIAEEDRKYLKFEWDGTLMEYTCLPNGLSQGPRFFTKLTKPIYSYLHSQGHISTGYLDDSLLVGQNKEECQQNIHDSVNIFQNLGFAIHPTKSVLSPVQVITYLGFVIDSINMTVELVKSRKDKLEAFCKQILDNSHTSIREVARLVGLMVSCFDAVPHGPLYYRYIEKEKCKALRKNKGNWERRMVLSHKAKKEIGWWIRNIQNCKAPICIEEPTLVIKSDASLKGWGAICEGQTAGGPWSSTERPKYHINELELLAAFFAIKSFAKDKKDIHVRIFVDNTVAMTCINKMGSIRSENLNLLTKDIWEWCISKKIWISAGRIAGSDNTEADFESRNINLDMEWRLDPKKLKNALRKLNESPDIDLFASRLNCQFKKFVSFRPDPEAYAVDAFNMNWSKLNFYAFPPFCLLPRVLQKIRQEKASGVVVAPLWPTQPFYPVLMKLLSMEPVVLSAGTKLLYLTSHPKKLHPLRKKLKLMLCKVSGRD